MKRQTVLEWAVCLFCIVEPQFTMDLRVFTTTFRTAKYITINTHSSDTTDWEKLSTERAERNSCAPPFEMTMYSSFKQLARVTKTEGALPHCEKGFLGV